MSARKINVLNKASNDIHGPYVPHDIRDGEPIQANIYSKNETFNNLRVWKLSPLGIEVIIDDTQNIEKGELINIDIFVGNEKSEFKGLVVDALVEGKNKIACIRLVLENDNKEKHTTDRRKDQRWESSNQFTPTGMAPTPGKFNDFIFFKVRDISADGLQIITSLRNKFLLQGMNLESVISFPLVSQLSVRLKIKNSRIITENEKKYLALGVAFDTKDKELENILGSYLVQFGNIESIKALRKSHIQPGNINNVLSFDFVRSEADYKEVLELRFKSYKKSGKLPDGFTPKDLSDAFDSRSRIVMGKYQGKLIATARLTYNSSDEKLEQEDYMTWPSHYPKRSDSIEAMRVCTDPDHRGKDLLLAMFKFIAATAAYSKRKYIVISTEASLLKLYKTIGFKETDDTYHIPLYNNKKHYVLTGNIRDSILGKDVSPIVWSIMYSELSDYLKNYNLIELTYEEKVRKTIYHIISIPLKFIYNIVKSNKYKSSINKR